MKIVYVLAFVFLAAWLIITGIAGLAGMPLSHVLATLLNLLALASGILLLFSVCKCHCSCAKCAEDVDKRDFIEKK